MHLDLCWQTKSRAWVHVNSVKVAVLNLYLLHRMPADEHGNVDWDALGRISVEHILNEVNMVLYTDQIPDS